MKKIEWVRVKNDSNGNPRYVCHFLQLNSEKELEETPNDWNRISNLYSLALARARKIGGKKFHNKQYGGGIVFQSYNLDSTEYEINKLLNEGN